MCLSCLALSLKPCTCTYRWSVLRVFITRHFGGGLGRDAGRYKPALVCSLGRCLPRHPRPLGKTSEGISLEVEAEVCHRLFKPQEAVFWETFDAACLTDPPRNSSRPHSFGRLESFLLPFLLSSSESWLLSAAICAKGDYPHLLDKIDGLYCPPGQLVLYQGCQSGREGVKPFTIWRSPGWN